MKQRVERLSWGGREFLTIIRVKCVRILEKGCLAVYEPESKLLKGGYIGVYI